MELVCNWWKPQTPVDKGGLKNQGLFMNSVPKYDITIPKYKKGGQVFKQVLQEQTFSKLLQNYYELYPICV